MKKFSALLCVVGFGVALAFFAGAADTTVETVTVPQVAPAETPAQPAPLPEENLTPAPTPLSWNPPPTECIQGLACSLPSDCPGGTCYLPPGGTPWDRRCICPLEP
jgi:hypothetical protein